MKKGICGLLAVVMLFLCLCGCRNNETVEKPQPGTSSPEKTEYIAVTQIDPCVVEPDDRLHMSDEDEEYYRVLMDTLLSRKPHVTLSQNKEKNEYYIDLLMQSPYYFFAKSCTLDEGVVTFEYAYSDEEQTKMHKFIDNKFLEIVNSNASKDDNELDIILKIYSAVASSMTYDSNRTDNKQLGSDLFLHPADEIYKGLKDKKGLCYAFAYTLRFALLQRGVDCFCVYGPCTDRNEAHMWNVFEYDGEFYTCDSTWDRTDEEYPKLHHFGKTDGERVADNLAMHDFSSKFFDEYNKVECTDKRFKIFRSISSYEYLGGHKYKMADWDAIEYTFDSQTFELK